MQIGRIATKEKLANGRRDQARLRFSLTEMIRPIVHELFISEDLNRYEASSYVQIVLPEHLKRFSVDQFLLHRVGG